MSSQTCVVVLVSEQTVQNVRFIKWFLKNNFQTGNFLLFVSTSKMEKKGKSEAIWNALEEKQKFFSDRKIILVDENGMADVQKNISNATDFSLFEKVSVSITGGTKLMSIASYNFFSKMKNAKIFYQPISDSLQELEPEQQVFRDLENLTLSEYFKAFSMNANFECTCIKDWSYNKNVLEKIESCGNGRKLLQEIQNKKYFKNRLDDKKYLDLRNLNQDKLAELFPEQDLTSIVETICKTAELFDFNPEEITKDEFRYITGGWFEEFVFQKIKEVQHLEEGKNIALNVSIESLSDAKNELDVVYVDSKNTLHIIECKSFIDQKSQGELLNNTIYKVQALKSKFGLTVKSHLYTMSVIDKENVLNRANDFGIEIVDGRKLCSEFPL